MARSRSARPAPDNIPLHPHFLRRIKADLPGEWPELLAALQRPAPASIRINTAKQPVNGAPKVPWCHAGRYLDHRPVFTLDPLLHAGCFYVQEASSMLVEQAVRASGLMDRDITALDLCAAPGGKSTHLRALLTPGSLLVANEVVPARRQALCENLWKWGLPNVVVTGCRTDRASALTHLFDLVLVDAPCSGEGMFRKDPFARQQWTPTLVDQCARVQREIIQHAWECLKPGGTMIYSTCTWGEAENEEPIEQLRLLGACPLALSVDPAWGLVPSERWEGAAWRAYPHRVAGEGFFIAALSKPGTAPAATMRPVKAQALPKDCATWCISDEEQHGTLVESGWHVVHAPHAATVERLRASVNVIAPGVPVATLKGGHIKPHAAWALNIELSQAHVKVVDADTSMALAYLRGEALRADQASGLALLTHGGHALGWLSGAGGRWNNGWPQPWRIRMRG